MPGSLGYEWIDAQTFASWGVDYLKYDGCFMEDFPSVLQDASRRYPFSPPPILRYPIMAEALNKTGRPISYLCNFPWQFWNLHKDVAMGGDWVGEFCNAWRVGGDASASFSNTLSQVDQSQKFASAVPSGPGRWNHLDSLEVGNNHSYENGGSGMTPAQEEASFTMYAFLKSPLFIGASAVELQGHSLDVYLNTEVIAVNQDPLGVRASLVNTTQNYQVWAVPLEGGAIAVAVLNRGNADIPSAVVEWTNLDVSPSTKLLVRDIWRHKDVGTFAQSFTTPLIPASGVVAFKLTPA